MDGAAAGDFGAVEAHFHFEAKVERGIEVRQDGTAHEDALRADVLRGAVPPQRGPDGPVANRQAKRKSLET